MFRSHKYVIAKRVIVNLHSGNAIDGVIVRQTGPLLVLKNATLHELGADKSVALDGEALVSRDQIDFIQAP